MIRDLVGADPALAFAAWEELSGVGGVLPGAEDNRRVPSTAGYFEF
jgi:hypothetical protein